MRNSVHFAKQNKPKDAIMVEESKLEIKPSASENIE